MGIAFNSALQVALGVTAVAVAAGYAFDNELVLDFKPLEIAFLIAATLLAGLVASNGAANWIEGVQLLAIYADGVHRLLVPVGRLEAGGGVRGQRVAARRQRVDGGAHGPRMVEPEGPLGGHVAQALGHLARGSPAARAARRAGRARRRRAARSARRRRAPPRSRPRRPSSPAAQQPLQRMRLRRGRQRQRPARPSTPSARRNTPRPSSTANTTSSPGAIPSANRTVTGIVTCPLAVTRDTGERNGSPSARGSGCSSSIVKRGCRNAAAPRRPVRREAGDGAPAGPSPPWRRARPRRRSASRNRTRCSDAYRRGAGSHAAACSCGSRSTTSAPRSRRFSTGDSRGRHQVDEPAERRQRRAHLEPVVGHGVAGRDEAEQAGEQDHAAGRAGQVARGRRGRARRPCSARRPAARAPGRR